MRWTGLLMLLAMVAVVPGAGLSVDPAPVQAHDAILVFTTDDEMQIDGDCSLREAIHAANTNMSYDFCSRGLSTEPDMIVLLEGTYTLTVGGAGEDGNMTGDLDVWEDAQFIGPGVAGAVIDGNGSDRVLEVHSGNIALTGIGIQNGATDADGGGVRAVSPLSTENVVISSNNAGGMGGGIASEAALTMMNTTVTGNDASLGGGIANTGTAAIDNSTLSGNSASDSGGGLHNCGPATLMNDTISGNTAASQGGGIQEGCVGVLTLVNVTIANNEASAGATAGAGGLFVDVQAGGTAAVKNTIISGNAGVNCLGTSAIASLGHNLEEGDTLEEPTLCGFDAGGDVVQSATSLGPLAQNDGITQSHALLPGSPAVDGAADDCPPPAGDQRSLLRPIDGDNDGDALCDIGSFESDPLGVGVTPTPSASTITPSATTPAAGTAAPTAAGTPGTPGPGGATATVAAASLPVTGSDGGGGSWQLSVATMALAAAVACGIALALQRARR
jgi:CSLREA domain-containing protein